MIQLGSLVQPLFWLWVGLGGDLSTRPHVLRARKRSSERMAMALMTRIIAGTHVSSFASGYRVMVVMMVDRTVEQIAEKKHLVCLCLWPLQPSICVIPLQCRERGFAHVVYNKLSQGKHTCSLSGPRLPL